MKILGYYFAKRVLRDAIFQCQLLHGFCGLSKETIIGIDDILVETTKHREKDVEICLVHVADEKG